MQRKIAEKLSNLRDNLICTGIILFILTQLSIIFSWDFLDVVQNTVQDFYITDYVSSGGYPDVGKDTNIVMVNIGHLNRKQIAEEIMILNSYKPKVIGIDATFFKQKKHFEYSKEIDSVPGEIIQVVGENISTIPSANIPEDLLWKTEENPKTEQIDTLYLVKAYDTLDFYLEYAFSQVENLVIVNKLEEPIDEFNFNRVSYPIPRFLKHVTTGFANVLTDSNENYRTVRYYAPYRFVGKDTIYSFAVELARKVAPDKAERFLERRNLKEVIRYRRNTDKYITLDYTDIFAKADSLQFLKDKIIIMAFLGTDINTKVTEDIFFTPLNHNYYGRCYPDMYGGVIHANVVSMILDEEYIGSMDLWPEWIKVFLITGLLVFINMLILNFIRINHDNWYEPLSVSLTISELFLMYFTIINVYKYFNFEIKLAALFYAIVLSGTIFETYHGSLKPIIIFYFNKISKKKISLEGGKE